MGLSEDSLTDVPFCPISQVTSGAGCAGIKQYSVILLLPTGALNSNGSHCLYLGGLSARKKHRNLEDSELNSGC